MKTLILNGSPRQDGDTADLIRELISHLHGEYTIFDCYILPSIAKHNTLCFAGCAAAVKAT